jgi:hypothetical protein
VRTPGPAILLKLPLDTAFPKLSGLGTGSSVLSISTKRGSSALDKDEGLEEEIGEKAGDVGHCRKS